MLDENNNIKLGLSFLFLVFTVFLFLATVYVENRAESLCDKYKEQDSFEIRYIGGVKYIMLDSDYISYDKLLLSCVSGGKK